MSDTTPTPARDDSDLPRPEDQPVEETPAVAGGQDDGEPEQGEGAQDSY